VTLTDIGKVKKAKLCLRLTNSHAMKTYGAWI